MATYDPKKITVVVNGVFLTGFSADSIVSAEMEEDRQTPHIGVMGEVDTAINANSAGKITVTLKSTSPSVRYLNNLANARIVFPITVADLNTNGTNASGTDAYVINPVMPEKGKEISDVEFEIFVGNLTIQ